MTDPYGDLLRQVLAAEAETIRPAGDGLARIQERVQRRRFRLRLLRPVLAAASLVALVAGGVVGAQLLESGVDELRVPPAAGPRPSAAAAATVPSSAATPTPSKSRGVEKVQPPSTPSAQPSSLPAVPDMLTIWPYATRREAAAKATEAMRSGAMPWLLDPKQSALLFVQNFLRRPEVDVVTATRPLLAGIGVTVGRRIAGGSQVFEVTTVYLVRVSAASNAPYVVVGASANYLTIDSPVAAAAVRSPVSVAGTITGVDEVVRAELRVLSRPDPLGTGTVPAGGQDSPWSLTLAFTGSVDRAGALVASTDSPADGGVARIVAQAVSLAPSGS